MLLAHQPSEDIKRIINEKTLPKYTSKTIINPKKLEDHLLEIRHKGFSVCNEELEEGVKAISVPVKNINKEIIASITVTGLSKRLSSSNIKKLIKILNNSAQELSGMLGYKEKNIF